LDNLYNDGKKEISISPARGYSDEIASMRNLLHGVGDSGGGEVNFNTAELRWMLPHNRDRVRQEMAAAYENRFRWRTNPADYQEYASLIRASGGDPAIRSEVAQYRTFEITSDIRALPFAMGAYQAINLSADELPMMVTPAAPRQSFAVRWIGQDGGARLDQWRTSRQAENIEIRMIATDKVEYTLFDLQQGFLNEVEAVNNQLRFDMEQKIDDLAMESMDANIFPSGLRAIMNIHPSIDQTNIPDTNYLDLTNVGTYGAANVLTLARLKAILHHVAMWGFGFGPDGPMNLQTMIMSPLNARDSWDYVDLVSGWDSAAAAWDVSKAGPGGFSNPLNTVPTGVREQIFNSGALLNSAWGYNWQSQFNARLPVGRMYVLTNQPIGWFFTKTEFDKLLEWRDLPDNVEQNYGQSMLMRAITFFNPQLWAYRFLVVDF